MEKKESARTKNQRNIERSHADVYYHEDLERGQDPLHHPQAGENRTQWSGVAIAFNSYGWFLGHYRYVEPKAFGFNRKFFNDPATGEAEVIDVIRHEYAHYYVDVTHLERYIGHSRRETSHGDDWKWACKMVGADPTRRHNNSDSIGKKWSITEAMASYNADDVAEFDALSYLGKWHQAPVDSETAEYSAPG